MTKDYTKLDEQKAPSLKAAQIHASAASTPAGEAKSHELEERICTKCYWIGRPRIIESGSWWGYLLPWIFDEPVTLHGCRKCNYPSSMVPIKSREGEQAMYWHLKNNSHQPFDKPQF